METSFSNQNVFDKVENWMANDTDEVTTPLSSYSDVGLAAGYEVHFSPDNERLFSDGLNEEKCMDCTRCSSSLDCCMCVRNRIAAIFRKIFPYGFKREFKGLFHIAWPITLTAILQSMLLFLSMTFCGHLGKESLDGVALATTIIKVTGTSVLYGLSSAFDTLLSQTFGSSNKQKIGLIMQRGVAIMGLTCLPIFAIFINTEHILLLIGQHHEVARLGGQYATILTVGFAANVGNIVLQKYLQTQSIVIPGVLILIVVNILNAGIHYLFLFVFDFGVVGAAIAVCITYWTEVVLHFLYIIVSGIYKDTWTGFSKECLTDWKPFLHLAIPGMFMICLEWWCFEILVFLCGLLGEVPLAAHVIVYYISSIVFMVPVGIAISVGIKVGNQLGAGNPEEAMTTSRVAISIVFFCGIINSILMMSLKDYIPRAFTDNLEVAHLASKLLTQLTIFCFFDFTQGTLSGVLRGIGHQKFGAIVNIIAYYLLALPMSIPLILYTSLQVAGAWWSMCVSVGFQSVAFFIRIVMCNWEVESEKAQIRAGVKKKDDTSKQSATRGHSIPSIIFEPDTVSTDTQLEQIEADHLTFSDISSYKSDMDENTTRHHSHLNGSIILCRVVVLVFFLIIFVGGIVLKFYLDDRIINNSVKCLLINGTNINMTYISTELSQEKFNLSTSDWHILNFTYFYERDHGYNSTFVYCRDYVEPYSPSAHWPSLNSSLLYPHHFY